MIKLSTILTFIIGFTTAHFLFQFQYSHFDIAALCKSDSRVSSLQRFTGTANNGCKETSDVATPKNDPTVPKPPEPKLEAPSKSLAVTSSDDKPQNLFPQGHPCSHFGAYIPSAATFWNRHLASIFEGVHRFFPEKEGENVYHDFTALLLHLMSTERLESSIKTVPLRSWDRIGELIDIANKRMAWVNEGMPKLGRDEKEPRRVYILVLGGSVTMGMGCDANPVRDNTKIGPRTCAWPTRVKEFLKSFIPKSKVKKHSSAVVLDIRSMSIGGTNTDSATTMWDYAVFPNDVFWPDIIIHSYSTNDMHVLSEIQAQNMNITLDEMIMRVNEKFIRSVLSRTPRPPTGEREKPCKPKLPILFYFDDYLGNEQRGIVKTMAFSNAINSLSAYYGFGVMSYADAVRDMVYSNTNETWFSPNLWPERHVHPGLGMHITSALVVAYNFLNLATTYCSLPSTLAKSIGDVETANDNPFGYAAVNGLPELLGDKTIENGPVSRSLQLPPVLNTNLTLDNLSTKWKDIDAAAALIPESGLQVCDDNTLLKLNKPCIYAWIAHLPKNPRNKDHINQRMDPVVKKNEGWTAVDEHGKVGYASEVVNSAFMMEFTEIEKPVTSITFMVMTSYGEWWEDSEIRVDIYVMQKGLEINDETEINRSMNIVGYHDRHTSEIFPHTAKLGDAGGVGAKVGDTLQIRIKHLSGKKFKIMGMAFCD